jgi:tetratricopeptide (TPR) repeat protein
MKACAVFLLSLVLSLVLAACATPPPAPQNDSLFNDQLFGAPSERISPDSVFALNDAMKHFVSVEIAEQLHAAGYLPGFVQALQTRGQLKLEYDAAMTRNASQAFDVRAGNCLSLVIMTAALAKEIGLSLRYQVVYVDDSWTRSGDVYFSVGHVNLTLGRRHMDGGFGRNDDNTFVIDFLPPEDIKTLRVRVIEESTVVAMYMNNRAAESFVKGRLNDAYWWARAAIQKDPRFVGAYNTLGVIYRRHGNLKEAEQTLAYALEREPDNAHVMSNLVGVLESLGRTSERTALAHKLEKLEPNPPFVYFNSGVRAMHDGNFKAAKDLFAKEVARVPYYHEFHFWLALAYVRLGEMEPAREQLKMAMEYTTTPNDYDLYAAKLARIRSYQEVH